MTLTIERYVLPAERLHGVDKEPLTISLQNRQLPACSLTNYYRFHFSLNCRYLGMPAGARTLLTARFNQFWKRYKSEPHFDTGN
jgi:hypothetical protein